jgi:nucleoside-diphosphate-sugar epimerase
VSALLTLIFQALPQHNIKHTVLEAVAAHNVNTLIYSSTCATYGEPDTMPIVEITPQVGPLMHELLNVFKCYG